MNEYFNELQEKFGYNNELIEVLEKIVPAFVEHYGKENEKLILDAISSCEIHIQEEKENPQQYVSNFFPNKDVGRIPSVVVGFYDSMPVVTDDGISAKRLIYITSKGAEGLQKESTISTLVHEIGHMIKSYNNEFSIVDNKIYQRSGISSTIIDENEETGKYISGEEFNSGLEEAINCYDEEKIMSIILGREYEVTTYFHNLNDAINHLFENQELLDIFRNAQINDTNEHIKHFGEEEFKKLSDSFELLYYIVLNPYAAKRRIGNGKGVSQLIEEAKSKIKNCVTEYNEKKKENFSLSSLEELDKEVTFFDREKGIRDLEQNFRETQKQIEIMEEK